MRRRRWWPRKKARRWERARRVRLRKRATVTPLMTWVRMGFGWSDFVGGRKIPTSGKVREKWGTPEERHLWRSAREVGEGKSPLLATPARSGAPGVLGAAGGVLRSFASLRMTRLGRWQRW